MDISKGGDVTCEESGTFSPDNSKNKLENERKELIEKISTKEREKRDLTETMASAEDAYIAIEEAKQKIESLNENGQLKKSRLVVQECSAFLQNIEIIEVYVQDTKYREVILLAKNIRYTFILYLV